MRHWLLFYDVAPHYLARRGDFRVAHLAHAQAAVDAGTLILGGALAAPVDGALLLFRAEGPDVAEAFAEHDPYVREGLVTGWRVREWTTVVGPDAVSAIGQIQP